MGIADPRNSQTTRTTQLRTPLQSHTQSGRPQNMHQGLTTNAIQSLGTQGSVPIGGQMQVWVDTTYSTGQRVLPALHPMPARERLQAQQQALPATGPLQSAGQRQSGTLSPRQSSHTQSEKGTSSTRPYPCPHRDCGTWWATRDALRYHQRCHRPIEQRPHACPYCDARFLYPREVERHLPSHGREYGQRWYCPDLECAYATEGFGRKDHLTRHLRSSQHSAGSTQLSSYGSSSSNTYAS